MYINLGVNFFLPVLLVLGTVVISHERGAERDWVVCNYLFDGHDVLELDRSILAMTEHCETSPLMTEEAFCPLEPGRLSKALVLYC
jgi:hypothetical protein